VGNTANRKAIQLCLVMGMVGVLYAIALTLFFPKIFWESNWDGFPVPIMLFMKMLLRLGRWPWAVITAAVLVIGIVRTRFRKRAWVLAMVVGSLLGHMAMDALR
jgi:hypothetical protein